MGTASPIEGNLVGLTRSHAAANRSATFPLAWGFWSPLRTAGSLSNT